jgi:hypothetical protein
LRTLRSFYNERIKTISVTQPKTFGTYAWVQQDTDPEVLGFCILVTTNCMFKEPRKYPYLRTLEIVNKKVAISSTRQYLRVVGAFLQEFLFSRLKCNVIVMLGYRLKQQAANVQR